MKKTIQKLKKKEQHEKERIAFVGALVVTLIIVMFWLVGITTVPEAQNDQVANTQSPFKALVNQFNDAINLDKK